MTYTLLKTASSSDLVGSVLSATNSNVGSLAPVLYFVGGLILAFFVIQRVIGFFHKTTPAEAEAHTKGLISAGRYDEADEYLEHLPTRTLLDMEDE